MARPRGVSFARSSSSRRLEWLTARWHALILVSALLVISCGGGGGSEAPQETPTPVSASPTGAAVPKLHGLTIEEVIATVPFSLVIPNPIPEGFVFVQADIDTNPADRRQIRSASLRFTSSDERIGEIVVDESPGPGHLSANPTTTTESTATINATPAAMLVSLRADGTRKVIYGVNIHDTFVVVSAISPGEETDAAIERFIAAFMK